MFDFEKAIIGWRNIPARHAIIGREENWGDRGEVRWNKGKNALPTFIFRSLQDLAHVLGCTSVQRKGIYDVVIAVYEVLSTCRSLEEGITVIECLEERSKINLKVVFIQHFPVFDYLCEPSTD